MVSKDRRNYEASLGGPGAGSAKRRHLLTKRIYLFGIGSPEWQRETGHTVNEHGVPIPMRSKNEG